MKLELVPHVDLEDTFLGTVDRATAYRDGLVHRGVHAFIQNEGGQYLIQKRSKEKASWPNHFDLSLAETVKPNESYDEAINRGLKEELGIGYREIKIIKPKYYQEYYWKKYKVFGIIYLYLLSCDEQPRFEDNEVQSSEWLSFDDVTNLIKHNPDSCTPWLVRDWQYLRELK